MQVKAVSEDIGIGLLGIGFSLNGITKTCLVFLRFVSFSFQDSFPIGYQKRVVYLVCYISSIEMYIEFWSF